MSAEGQPGRRLREVSPKQLEQTQALAMDMWKPFAASTRAQLHAPGSYVITTCTRDNVYDTSGATWAA